MHGGGGTPPRTAPPASTGEPRTVTDRDRSGVALTQRGRPRRTVVAVTRGTARPAADRIASGARLARADHLKLWRE